MTTPTHNPDDPLESINPEQLMYLPAKLRQRIVNFLVRWRRYAVALPLVRRLVEEQPEGLLYRSMLVKVLAGLEQLDEASIVLEELEAAYPFRPNTLAAAGDLESARGDLPSALKSYLKILETNPESPKAFRRLAGLYLAAGQPEKARACCRKVIDSKEDAPEGRQGISPDIFRVLAQIHRQLGDDSVADELGEKLRTQEKEDGERLIRDVLGSGLLIREPEGIPLTPTLSRGGERESAGATAREGRGSDPADDFSDGEGFAIPPPEERPPVPDMAAGVGERLAEVFGHNCFRGGQQEAVARILAGQDLLLIMPTGGGKSLCYQLPAALGRKVVVISPLIALMKDQVDGLPEAVARRTTLINSTLDSDELERRQVNIAQGRYDLIYAAPERLRQLPFLHALKKAEIDILVVDEVHCVSIWGHDFRPDYLFIRTALEYLGRPTFCGMTATAAPAMRKEIEERIGRNLVTVSTGVYRPNLRFEVRRVSKNQDKLRELARIARAESGSGIIYVNSRKKTEEIADYLGLAGVQSGFYHAGMEPDVRTAAQEAFMSGKCRVMAATVAFGMGIDKSDVRFVAHFTMPKSLESYYQEAGRAGRDGLPSRCILFYSPDDELRLASWIRDGRITMDELRSTYQAIKNLLPDGSGPTHEDDILRETGLEGTRARVMVSLLERAGLIRRMLDVPISINISVNRASDVPEEFAEFVRLARLRERQRLSMESAEISSRTGIAQYDLEASLLRWRDDGLISYRASGRTMYLELCRATRDSRTELDSMLESHCRAANEKARLFVSYIKGPGCRFRYISRYFGEQADERCETCDNCIKGDVPNKLRDEHVLILRGIRCLPTRLGKAGLIKALVGASTCPIRPHEWPQLGAYTGKPKPWVERLIDDLLAWGYLEKDGTPLRPLLALTSAGRKLVREGEEEEIFHNDGGDGYSPA